MPNITPHEIQALARIAGLSIDDDRAETIAPRLLALNLERAEGGIGVGKVCRVRRGPWRK